jgi:UTP:GlnB (protein PII) uridylyltransferase
VDFYDDRDSTFTEVTICSLDDPAPGLLSKIAGVLYAADLEVHSAQVFTRVAQDERIAIDSLFVDFKGRRLTPGKRNELATGLTTVLTGQTTVADLLTIRRKPPEIGGQVDRITLRNDLSQSFSVVEVASRDERAMLYRASGALSALGWDIHSARVSQFKGRSVASFYVTGPRAMGEQAAKAALFTQFEQTGS